MNLIRYVLHICFLFLPFLVTAQDLDAEKVKEINRQALQLHREGEFDQAEKLLEDLLGALEKENSELAYKAVTWQTLAKVVMNQGDYDRSFDLARRSLSF